ncbi:MAG: hypothetical protein IIX96_00400, partial [Clostridia bacterium]|nr:hypothetical protein [Clostridia bacterium]
MKRLFAFLFLFTLLALTACAEPPAASDTTYNVMVFPIDGMSVTSENPVRVKEGGTASFDVTVENGYIFEGVSIGSYDSTTGKLTVMDVRQDTAIDFTLRNVGYDTSASYDFYFRGSGSDTSSIGDARQNIKAGTSVTVRAVDTSRRFVGWSFGKTAASGGSIISREREFSFEIRGELADSDGRIIIFPNYSDAVVYAYGLNGGMLNTGSKNMQENPYYTAEFEDGVLLVTLNEIYFSKMDCASLFYDDGTFSREGYVLKEYNTKPDGSGEGYSLGSKLPIVSEGDSVTTLYCIWSEETAHSDFTYESYTYEMPEGCDSTKAPDFHEDGVILTSYSGNARTVTVPQTIGGRYVIAIAEG